MAGYVFGCPHCRAKLEARDFSRAGRTVVCPQCDQSLIIPPPPPMGVPLHQTLGHPSTSLPADASQQVVVSSDPGFKRPMSPAKAYSESDILPAPSSSGFDRLPLSEPLQTGEAFTLEAGDALEGYSFNVPENGTEGEQPPAFKFKKKRTSPQPETAEAPHPFEDPKYQLAALLAVIVVVGGIWTWLRSGADEREAKRKQAEVAAPQVLPSPPSTPPPGIPGADSSPSGNATPGTLREPPEARPVPPTQPGTPPEAVPSKDPPKNEDSPSNPASSSDTPD